MDGMNAVGSVGAGLSQAQFQAEYQMRAMAQEISAIRGVGDAVLQLIQSSVISVDGSVGQNLDVRA
jgi:hypothetical protein